MGDILKSPYPYFGGKSRVAKEVWRRFGKCDTYIEPFFGSGAVLLANPYWETTIETVNDLNHYIANFWRAVRADPDAVAQYADYPVSEIDLHLRHIWLVNEGAEIIKRCETDMEFYDARVAGYWVWGMALWIGGGFCDGNEPWTVETIRAAQELGTYDIREIKRRRPEAVAVGRGVGRRLPHLGGAGRGVYRKLPHLGSAGHGVTCQDDLADYINQLSRRMRRVRVCCGDWERVVKPAVTGAGEDGTTQATCGVFLDPPYSKDANRDMRCYGKFDDGEVAHRVREWCTENQDNRLMRIALCGYIGDGNDELAERGWTAFRWKAGGGYSAYSKQEQSKLNRGREVIWFSPACLDATSGGALFQ